MSTVVDALILDLLRYVAAGDRPYDDVMDAWRTSCPRLPVWEEASSRELIKRVRLHGQTCVRLAPAGRALLKQAEHATVTGS
jgi:D-3-phosphoglycerate dehydrogenase